MSAVNAAALLAAAGGEYQISRSVRLRSSASAYFNRTPASAGNRQVMTFSWWMKLGNTAGAIFGAPATTNPRMQIYYNGPSDGRFELYQSDSGGTQVCYTLTTARYRDPSAWYHFVIAIDTTQATAANRIKWYVNGVQLTAFDTAAYPAQNTNMEWNAAAVHNIGRQPNGGSFWDGYLTEVNFIDGQALTPSSFGETDTITGVWKPKRYTGTYGTNGFYLNFSDNSAATAAAIGKDYSGNGNNWTPNNISVTSGVTYDSMLDVPTPYADGGNGRGNYCVLNPLRIENVGIAAGTISDGNLKVTTSATNAAYSNQYGSMAFPTSGGWYYEAVFSGAFGNSAANYVGIIGNSNSSLACTLTCTTLVSIQKNFSNVQTGLSFSPGDVLGVAFDATNLAITFYKNGSILGSQVTGLTSAEYIPFVLASNGAGTQSNWIANFGQRPFAYTPPTGFKALNTQNLPDSTIKKGNQFFDVSLYTGTGAQLNVTNSGAMQPDLVWLKARSSAFNNLLTDSVRGTGLGLISNSTAAEASNGMTAFSSNGFQVQNNSETGANGVTYVGWQWKESASAGFDIVTYTGNGANRTVSHSLGVAPAMMIVKRRDNVGAWFVYHQSQGATKYMTIDTAAATTSATAWNNTAPSSSVFTVGTDNNVNGTSGTYVNYLFAEVAGFSRFGSYTGNGSTDGPFVFCGFRPRFIMYKRTDTIGNWNMLDTTRSTFNVSQTEVVANQSIAEFVSANANVDVNANGFKLRTTDGDRNASGGTYIFAAFAENPFKNSLAR